MSVSLGVASIVSYYSQQIALCGLLHQHLWHYMTQILFYFCYKWHWRLCKGSVRATLPNTKQWASGFKWVTSHCWHKSCQFLNSRTCNKLQLHIWPRKMDTYCYANGEWTTRVLQFLLCHVLLFLYDLMCCYSNCCDSRKGKLVFEEAY